MKNIAVFGSTGSIGRQTLSVAKFHKDRFRVKVLAANSNTELIAQQIREFNPETVGLHDEKAAKKIASEFPGIKVVSADEVNTLAALPDIDTVVNGVSGFSGLMPLLYALKAGKTVALANKESIVCGHALVNETLKKYGGKILPVDSEQSAIFQCLAGGRKSDVKKLILTASGGMFRDFTEEQLEKVTPEMALKHPTWSMGRKITVDSSSLFNKGLEIMEAGWLFDIKPDSVEVLIHPQSVVHSMVEFKDNAVLAQLSLPDMRLAIQYALTYPERCETELDELDLAKLASLTFYKPDTARFPAIPLAYEAFRDGNTLPIAFNSANEAAVSLFLEKRIGFTQIAKAVEYAMKRISRGKILSVSDILMLDAEARTLAREFFGDLKRMLY